MKKKIIVCLFVLLGIISITGCVKKDEEKKEAYQVVKIAGEEIELKSFTNFKNFYYKESIKDFYSDTIEYMSTITIRHDSKILAYISIVDLGKHTVEEVMNLYQDITYTDKTCNGIAYKYLERDDVEVEGEEKKANGHFYLAEYDGTLYQIGFVSNNDFKDLESAIMDEAYFKAY